MSADTRSGRRLSVPYRPFHGTLGVAPAHGEVRLGLAPGDFGGNLDIPELTAGATLYLRANRDGGHLYIGDGHYAQGDGEIAGTAIEGAFRTTLTVERAAADDSFDWPRLETATMLGVIGCGRPVDDALRIAAAGLVKWVGPQRLDDDGCASTGQPILSAAHRQPGQSVLCRAVLNREVRACWARLRAIPGKTKT